MKMLVKFLILITLLFSVLITSAQEHELTIMTFNVRYDTPADGVNAWPNRISLIEEYMNHEKPDIVGMQENLYHQNEDLLSIMPGYTYIGTGRDDGKQSGEFSPLFYRTDVFELLEHSQFWLSETPDVPGSIGWEAVLPRVVTWAKFRHIESNKKLYVFNTHFSHVSDLARRKSMEFMADQIQSIAGTERIIVTGDFNIAKGSQLYYDMLARFYRYGQLQNAELISADPVNDAYSTFNGFRDNATPVVIDYIFVNNFFEVVSYHVDKIKKGDVFISDHWPVKAVVKMK
jgi:endonuclease/exonuclease/phosphatase family metal-dependent hydrolase